MILHSDPVLVADLQAGTSPLVVQRALLGVAQNLLGLLQLLENPFGLLIAAIFVRMIFHRQHLISKQRRILSVVKSERKICLLPSPCTRR